MKDLSVVVTTVNRKSCLLECVESIAKSDFSDIEWELIIIDDCSSDGTEKLKGNDFGIKNTRVVHNKTQEYMIASRNIGIRESSGRQILFVDDDNVVDRLMIKTLFEFQNQNPEFGIVGPSMYYFQTKKKYTDYQRFNFYTGKTNCYIDSDKRRKIVEADGISNVFMVEREVFKKTGCFDEKLISDYTELELAVKAAKTGFKCAVIKMARTYHKLPVINTGRVRHQGGHRPQVAYCLIRNRFIIVLRYGTLLQKVVFLSLFSWLWPLVYSFSVLRSRRFDTIKLYWRGWFDGVRYLFFGSIDHILKIS